MMTHDEYPRHLGRHFACHFVCHGDSGEFTKVLENCRRELIILVNLNLDPKDSCQNQSVPCIS